LIGFLIYLINLAANVLELLVVAEAVLSFFLSPLHPVRRALGRIVNPLLAPIQRVVPPLGGFDISPIILILLIEVSRGVLIRLLQALIW